METARGNKRSARSRQPGPNPQPKRLLLHDVTEHQVVPSATWTFRIGGIPSRGARGDEKAE